MADFIDELITSLNHLSDPARAEKMRRFFKEDVKGRGIPAAEINHIARITFKQISKEPKLVIFRYCERMFETGYLAECLIACHWSYAIRKQYTANDMDRFEKWITLYVTNWAVCDTFCNKSVGELLLKFPDKLNRLSVLARSVNRWERRAAAVSLIVPGRQGLYLKNIYHIADLLLEDSDDMVQKGYGWMLKVASQKHLTDVFRFVNERKSKMPRTALRYAIEKMPNDMKAEAMLK